MDFINFYFFGFLNFLHKLTYITRIQIPARNEKWGPVIRTKVWTGGKFLNRDKGEACLQPHGYPLTGLV